MLRISSFNIQNNYRKYNINKTKDIMKYLKDNNIDILGLQEVFYLCDKDICKRIDNDYSYFGKYRFYSRFILRHINEMTPIITNKKVIEKETYRLPFFPSPIKRILTKVVIEYEGKLISIYNTHLEVRNQKVKEKQLKKIYDLISNDNNLIILMGDFNLKNNKEIFNKFEDSLKEKGIYRVEFNHKTLKISKYKREIDHIFLSNEFKLLDKKVIEDLNISDHYPVMVDVKL